MEITIYGFAVKTRRWYERKKTHKNEYAHIASIVYKGAARTISPPSLNAFVRHGQWTANRTFSNSRTRETRPKRFPDRTFVLTNLMNNDGSRRRRCKENTSCLKPRDFQWRYDDNCAFRWTIERLNFVNGEGNNRARYSTSYRETRTRYLHFILFF